MMNEENNSIVEINNDSEDTLYDNDKIVSEVNEASEEIVVKPKKHRKLSKKGLIIIISSIVLLLAVVGIILYFLVFKKDKKEETPKEPEKIILQEDNYTYEDGILKIKDGNNEIGTYDCIDKDINKCYVAYLTNEDDNDMPIYEDEDGKAINLRSSVYFGKYVFINDENVVKLYDLEKNEVLEKYQLIKTSSVSSNYVIAKDENNKYGVLELTSDKVNTLLKFEYDDLSMQTNSDKFVSKTTKGSYIIDTKGEKLTNQLKGTIKNFDQLHIALYDNNKYSLYDYKGTKILSDYDFITFYDTFIICMKNSKMYVFDKDLNKLNIDGISINEKDYITRYVFDENNKFKESIKPFEFEAGKGFIRVIANKGLIDRTLSSFEAIINQRYDYVSYLDGKLYIYNDRDKTDLAYTYICNNLNDVTSEEGNYENCFVAKNSNIVSEFDDNYYLPIFFSKYVFINDTSDSENPKINVYDITNGKLATSSAANYKKVDFKNSDANIKIIESANNQIIYQNSFGYFGVIKLDTNGISSVIRSNDSTNGGNTKKISYFKNYYLVERDSNYLYSLNGGEPVASSQYQIVDYFDGKMVVYNNYYMIYNNGKIISNDFVYVKTNANYFVGIDKNNKLNVYGYSSNEGFIAEALTVLVTSDYAKAYEIVELKKDNDIIDGYQIKIYSNENDFESFYYTTDWSLVV